MKHWVITRMGGNQRRETNMKMIWRCRESRQSCKDEVKRKNPKVEAKIAQLVDMNKRKPSGETKAPQAAKRQKRIEAREAALACPAPDGMMKTLRQIRKEIMKKD